jgi:OmpR-family two-component system manganese-sensing response regulator
MLFSLDELKFISLTPTLTLKRFCSMCLTVSTKYEHTKAQILFLTDAIDQQHDWQRALTEQDIGMVITRYDRSLPIIPTVSPFHLIIVDHHHDPDHALLICGELRVVFQQPLLLFTYEISERFHLEAYQLGVEECIVRPIGMPLFVAKVLSWLSKTFRYDELPSVLESSTFYLDSTSKTLQTFTATVTVSDFECRLMQIFMTNNGTILEERFLEECAWSIYAHPDSNWLKALVRRLHTKIRRISDDRSYIEYIPDRGYVFRDSSA